jgi:hypothetical protein
LPLVDPGIVWYYSFKPFLFDIIGYFANNNIPKSKRLFTLICNYFNLLTVFIVACLATPKLELVTIKATKNVIVDRTFKITVSPPTILIPLKPSDSPFNSRPADIVVIECDGSPMPSIIHIFECIMNQMDKNNIGQRTQDLLAGWLGGKLGGMAVGKISKLNTSLSRGAEEFLKVGAITAIAYGKHSHLPAIVADHVLGQWSNPNKVEIKSPLVVQKHRTSDLSYWTPQGFLLPLAVEAYQMYSFVGKAMRAYDAAGIFRDAAASVRGCGLPFGHAVICVPD